MEISASPFNLQLQNSVQTRVHQKQVQHCSLRHTIENDSQPTLSLDPEVFMTDALWLSPAPPLVATDTARFPDESEDYIL